MYHLAALPIVISLVSVHLNHKLIFKLTKALKTGLVIEDIFNWIFP